MRSLLLPVLWYDEGADITPDYTRYFRWSPGGHLLKLVDTFCVTKSTVLQGAGGGTPGPGGRSHLHGAHPRRHHHPPHSHQLRPSHKGLG